MTQNIIKSYKQFAIEALTSRFNQTEAQATALIEALPQTEMYSLPSEINRQADFIEETAENLIISLHFDALTAIDEIYRILTHKDDIPRFESRDHVPHILKANLNPEFLRNGMPLHVRIKLEEKLNKVRQDELRDIDFENAKSSRNLNPQPIPKTPAEEAQAVWDYNAALLIKELEISAEDSAIRMSKIPLEHQNSITHHLHGRTGFVTRFKTYMARIMGETIHTYEEITQAMYEVAKGAKASEASIDISPYLNSNEMETVYRFQPWHFNLLSQKTCDQFHKLYPQIYALKDNTIVCKPIVIPNLPVVATLPALVELPEFKMSSKVLPSVPTNMKPSMALMYLTSVGVFGVAMFICANLFRQRSMFSFFNKSVPKRSHAKTYDSEVSLYRPS